MKLNNKGFALTSIIYMLIVLFLMIMLLILANLAQRKVVLDKIKYDVKEKLNQGGLLASNSAIVTFDPNGGQVSQTRKEVRTDEPYGELPIPTKEGYTFKAWRGKNLYNKNATPETNGSYITSNGSKISHGSYAIYKADVKPNTQYTITNSGKSNAPGYALYDENYNFITGAGYGNTANVTFTTPANAVYIRFSVVANQTTGDAYRYDKDYFQLEEGSTATSYELYQEYTKDTIVTKKENHTLYAVWNESMFITGSNFNAKIKQLAGNTNATYETEDTNITSIQRATTLPSTQLTADNIVSAPYSNTPIYAWYDNGTIYYYSEAAKIYLHPSSNAMFTHLHSLTQIDISTLDTTQVNSMSGMFSYEYAIQTLDLRSFKTNNVVDMYHMFFTNKASSIDVSSFNTSKVQNMNAMFYGCTNLTSLNVSNFNTSSVNTGFEGMFMNTGLTQLDVSNFDTSQAKDVHNMFKNLQITNLDISNFDLSSATNTTNMLDGMTNLTELKTPKVYPADNSLTITLPKTMYDISNNSYTTLGSGSPTETILKDTQTQ